MGESFPPDSVASPDKVWQPHANGKRGEVVMKRRLGLLVLPLIVLAIAGHGANAQDAESFYKGKTLRIVVGFSPGGGFDLYARLLARHYGPYIPGHPEIIVNNMPGASSLKAVQYLDAGAPKDGTVITAFNSGLITSSLTSPARFPIRFTDVAWVGSISEELRVCYIWAATGLKTLEDMQKRPQVTIGETGTGSSAYVNERILKLVFGVNVKQVLGYPGSAEKRLAIERGELDADCGAITSIPTEWLRDNKVNVVIRFEDLLVPGLTAATPYANDLVDDPDRKALLTLLNASGDVARPYIVSKSVPKDRLKALRDAFDRTLKDPQFLADAEKQKLIVIAPMGGEKAERYVEKVYQASPAVVAEAKKITGE
jgi:tripartite-type tricarboxylate transporter receptor subunit TctC